MSQHPPIQIVDETDEPAGSATIDDAYAQGLIHRIIYIIVENPDGKILLQKRSDKVVNYPNRWDISSAGHVDDGEDYETAARRELREELGLTSSVQLEEIDYFRSDEEHYGHVLHRFNKVYKSQIPAGTKLKLQANEVANTEWFSVEEIKQMIASQPETIASGLSLCIKRYY